MASVGSIFSTALGNIYSRLGEAATYTPLNDLPTSVTLVPGLGNATGYMSDADDQEYRGADDFGQVRSFRVRVSEITTASMGDRIQLTGDDDIYEVTMAGKDILRLEWLITAGKVSS